MVLHLGPRMSILTTVVTTRAAPRSLKPPMVRPFTTDAQRERLGRPISPHLTVYKQALPALSSILNRVTGVVLSFGVGGVSAIAAFGGDVPSVVWTAAHATPAIAPLAKFAVAFPLAYHWMGGCRHQFWSMYPQFMTIKFAQRSSAAIVCAAVILSGVSCVSTLSPRTQTKG